MTLALLAPTAGTPATVPPDDQVTASAISASVPPQRPSARTARTLDLNAIPATPAALLVTAATVPATWVPCQLELLAGEPAKHWPAVLQSPGSSALASRPLPSLAVVTLLMKS